jgi:hypothetical protein
LVFTLQETKFCFCKRIVKFGAKERTDNMQGEHVDHSEGGGPAQKRTNTKRSRAVPIAMGLAEGGKAIIKKAQKRCLGNH